MKFLIATAAALMFLSGCAALERRPLGDAEREQLMDLARNTPSAHDRPFIY